MQREFLNLENIMLGGLFLILLVYSGFMISCTPRDGISSDAFSLSDGDDDDIALADSRRGDRRDRRPCEDRDSCQDSCDYMFRNSSARSDCYALNFDDVSDLEQVFDELHSSSISKRSLEDIDVNDFEDFLELDIDGWIDIIVGEEGGDHNNHNPYDTMEAKSALEWIAENENVARVISRTDEHHDVLYHLFLRLGNMDDITFLSTDKRFFLSNQDTNDNGSISIEWLDSNVRFSSNTLSLGSQVLEFILSFIGAGSGLVDFDDESFISYAHDEDNEQAIELAHESLVRFCEEGTDDELPDEDVQQCMLVAYCSIYAEENSDNIFEDVLNDHNAEPEDCAPSRITDDDVLEKLFD